MNYDLILVNGPPRSGKGTVARALQREHSSFQEHWVARSLKERTHLFYDIQCDHLAFDDCKDIVSSAFHGLCPREAYIAYGEMAKRLHGKDFWAKMLWQTYLAPAMAKGRIPVVSDVGFQVEVDLPTQRLAGAGRILVVRTSREGYSFSNDSRNYVVATDATDLPSCSTVEQVEAAVKDLYRREIA
jgi:hypothetical protein